MNRFAKERVTEGVTPAPAGVGRWPQQLRGCRLVECHRKRVVLEVQDRPQQVVVDRAAGDRDGVQDSTRGSREQAHSSEQDIAQPSRHGGLVG
jgi:hypothetical protein